MTGAIAITFLLISDSSWWLVSKNKLDRATKVLDRYNGRVRDYDVQEQIVSEI